MTASSLGIAWVDNAECVKSMRAQVESLRTVSEAKGERVSSDDLLGIAQDCLSGFFVAPGSVLSSANGAMCDRCEVWETCVRWSFENRRDSGVYGKLSPGRRDELLKSGLTVDEIIELLKSQRDSVSNDV